MLRAFPILAAVLLAGQSIASPAGELQPTGKWQVEYNPTSCEAKRRFGDTAIAIIPGPLGQSTRLMVELPGKALRARQYPAMVDPGDGSGAVKATALLFPMKQVGLRGVYSVLPNTLVDRAMASGSIGIQVGKPKLNIRNQSADVSLALGPTAALRKALDTCMADLRKQWNMVDGKLPVPANVSQAQGNVFGLIRDDDYPEDAVNANQSGNTRYLLMIGPTGAVMDCVITVSSGVASLDAMGCQVMRERARFKPATDASGKPTVDTYLTPFIAWRMTG